MGSYTNQLPVNDQLDQKIEEILADLTIEESAAVFLACIPNNWRLKPIMLYFQNDPNQFKEFVKEVAECIDQEQLSDIVPNLDQYGFFRGEDRPGLVPFYFNLKPELRNTFVNRLKVDSSYSQHGNLLEDLLMDPVTYDLASDLVSKLIALLTEDQLSILLQNPNWISGSKDKLLELLEHYNLFKDLIRLIFKDWKDNTYSRYNNEEGRERVLTEQNEMAEAIIANIPEEDLATILSLLKEHAPVLRFHAKVLAEIVSEKRIIEALKNVIETENNDLPRLSLYVTDTLAFIGKNNENTEQLLHILVKATREKPMLIGILKESLCREADIVRKRGIQVPNWEQILSNVLPTLDEDFLVELIPMDNNGATFLRILTTVFGRRRLGAPCPEIRCQSSNSLSSGDDAQLDFTRIYLTFLVTYIVMRESLPLEDLFLMFCKYQNYDFFGSCLMRFTGEKIKDFDRFIG